jgi:hypothetical protein
MESNQEEMRARLEAKMDSHHEKFEVLWGTVLSQMDVHQAKTEANHEELIAAMKTTDERIEALLDVSQEVTEAYPEIMEVNLGELQSVTEHEVVPKEEAAVKPFRALKKQHGDWHLAIRHRDQTKKWTQGNGGSQKKLAAVHRGMTHHAGVEWHKGHGQDNVVEGTQKGRTFGRRHRVQPECNNGIRDQGAIRQLHLRKGTTTGNGIRGRSSTQRLRQGSRTTLNKAFGETLRLKTMKRAVRISSGL